MTSSKLRFGSKIFFFSSQQLGKSNTLKLTELPHYIKIQTMYSNIINTLKIIKYMPHAALNNK